MKNRLRCRFRYYCQYSGAGRVNGRTRSEEQNRRRNFFRNTEPALHGWVRVVSRRVNWSLTFAWGSAGRLCRACHVPSHAQKYTLSCQSQSDQEVLRSAAVWSNFEFVLAVQEGEGERTTRIFVPARVWALVFAMLMTLQQSSSAPRKLG